MQGDLQSSPDHFLSVWSSVNLHVDGLQQVTHDKQTGVGGFELSENNKPMGVVEK